MAAHSAIRRLAPLAALTLAAACARPESVPLPPYQLANGQILQDVVTVAASASGGAPVITSVTTYDIGTRGATRVIARDTASGPGPGQILASGLGQVVTSAGVILVARELDDNGGTTVNASYATAGNTATGGGDAGDIDAVTAATGTCGSDCSVSN